MGPAAIAIQKCLITGGAEEPGNITEFLSRNPPHYPQSISLQRHYKESKVSILALLALSQDTHSLC